MANGAWVLLLFGDSGTDHRDSRTNGRKGGTEEHLALLHGQINEKIEVMQKRS